MRTVALALTWLLFGCLSEAQVEDDIIPAGPSRPPVAVYSSQIGGAAEGADNTGGAAPRHPSDDCEGCVGRTSQRVLDAVAQGQGGVHKGAEATESDGKGGFRYKTSQQAIDCEALLADAADKTPACAAELKANNCARGDRILPGECPRCAELSAVDANLSQYGCPPRPQYPTLREK